MTEIKLNQTVTDLLSTANSLYPGNISVRFGDTKAGYVRHDQAQQVLDDGDLTVRVSDITAPNYTASHELLHLLLLLPVSYTHLTLPTTRLVCRSRWSPYH